LNRPEKREKAWYIYVIKPQGGLDHDVCGLGFSNYGNVPTRQIARLKAAQNNSATLLVYRYDTEDSTLDAR